MFKAILLHHNVIKIIAILVGYSFWSLLAQRQVVTITQKIPLCFYQNQNNHTIQAPDFVTLTLSGKRKQLYLYQPQNMAIHLDASDYQPGVKNLQLSQDHIFLPNQITLQAIQPHNLEITIT